MPPNHKLWRRVRHRWIFFGIFMALLDYPRSALGQQGSYYVDPTVARPAACYGTEEFYSLEAFPYFDNDGYYFDANPFLLSKWISTTSAIYRSSKGYSLVDQSGTKIWTNARVAASCYEFNAGIFTVHFARVDAVLGILQDRSVACAGSGGGGTGGSTDPTAVAPDPMYDSSYDPYDPYGCSDPSSSADGGGGSSPGPGGSTCQQQDVVIEISYDGGLTWSLWWEGDATVCQ